MQGSLPDSAEEGLEQIGEATYPELLGKSKEKLRIGGKESFQAQCMREYCSLLLPRSILRGSTGALEARGDLHSRATGTMRKM
jgi:hypothetical protein